MPTATDFSAVIIAGKTVDVIGMICNILLILVIIIDPLKILHRGAWITILNISVADFIACGSNFVTLLFAYENIHAVPQIAIDVSTFFWMLGVGASFMLLASLNVQIYIIIKYPMKSRLMLTTKKVVLSCIIVWAAAIGMGLTEIGYIWISGNEVFYLYIAKIASLEMAVVCQVVLKILTAVEILGSRYDGLNAETQNQKQKEVAKVVTILNVILIVTALPYFLAKQIEYIGRLGDSSYDSLVTKFPYYYQPVALLNFVLNPLLYSLRMRDYRRSLIALFTFNCKKRTPFRSSSLRSTIYLKTNLSNLEIRETRL
ncbi:galanin receptor type 2-like [Paramuricea clavata]|uniref:Galanin receptor type 2-like n=1 Tax=Paramuricea clavata TaxID=317549 RepID=A0A6S7IH13_PARCT|nr:galanin receptor type 2-like [Paramuricea clavata]